MTLKKQLQTLKDNWLLVAAVVVFLLLTNFNALETVSYKATSFGGMDYAEESVAYDMARGVPAPMAQNFAPEVEERKITKTASVSSKVERGTFASAEQKVKEIVDNNDVFLLNENAYTNGEGKHAYRTGNYQLKVNTVQYETILAHLKSIGEVTSFNENTQDITGQYTNREINLETEKARLARFNQMYNEADRMEDKIELSDRIFNQERTIKYLEDSIENMDKRIVYSTIHFSLQEEQSGYANMKFVTLSQLVRNLVSSINSLLSFLFSVLPWAVFALLIWGAWRLTKKR